MKRRPIFRHRLAVLVLCELMIASLILPEFALAFRGGGRHGGSVHASNSAAYRAGRHQGAHAGYNAGFHHGAHAGYHAGRHHGGWGWGPHVFWHPTHFWHPFGFFLATLATTAIIVSIADHDSSKVYYDNGTYYEQSNQSGQSGYVVVPAPIGARVPTLPDGNTEITVGSTDYYYYAGTFYVQDTDQVHYVVVQAPVGAVVPYLPDGNEKKKISDIQYYVYDGIYYQPKSSNGQVVYQVVQHP